MFVRVDGRSGMAGAPEVLADVDDKTDGPAELPEVAAVVEVMARRRRSNVSRDYIRDKCYLIDTNQGLEAQC